MKISRIEENEKVSSMFTVWLDNNITFCLPKKRIELLELKEGKYIPDETLDYILKTEVYAAAKSAAVNFLAMKLRTEYEVAQKLSEMGYNEATIEMVVEDLKEINYIDDSNYTVKYISEKSKLKPKSMRLLSIELSRKGIPEAIISSAFEEFEYDEGEAAIELLKKKYSKFEEYDEKLIRKMKAFLLARGFSYSQVSKAVATFLPDE